MRIAGWIVVAVGVVATVATAQAQDISINPSAPASAGITTGKPQLKAKTQKYTVVMVWQDAWLYTSTAYRAKRVRPSEPTIPRRVHPMIVLGQQKNGWLRVQSVSAFETPHRLPQCPLPGFADLNVELYVRAQDVASAVQSTSLPVRGPYHREVILDPCLEGLARLGKLPPAYEKPEEPKPAGIISPLVRHLPAKAPLMWRDGNPAGSVRYDRPLPLNVEPFGELTCFDLNLRQGVIGLSSLDDSRISVCARTRDVRGL